MNTVDYALFYAAKGWRVFPIQPNAKTPYSKDLLNLNGDGGFKVATTEKAIIQKWFTEWPQSNIAIATGAWSGIVVLDVDPEKGGDESLLALQVEKGRLPHTVESLTGGGGRHLIFHHPGIPIKNSTSDLGQGLDIRGDGGYIVAPPSIHPCGNAYQWELSSKPSQIPLAEMPSWLVDMIQEPEDTSKPKLAAKLPEKISQGTREKVLCSLAGTMRRRGANPEAILAAIDIENDLRCEPPLPQDDLKRIAKSIGNYEPVPEPQFSGQNEIQRREPKNAYEVGLEFNELLDNLEGRSIYTYIPQLDDAMGGLERQTLSVLAARPSVGKSTLGWQIIRNVTASGLKGYFFSLEMSSSSLWAKAACGSLGIRWRDVRALKVTNEVLGRLADESFRLMRCYENRLLIDDAVNTTQTIWECVERHKPDFVLIDHLRLVSDNGENEVQRLGLVSKRLKEVAIQFNCHVMAIAQLNRRVESSDNKRPQLSDLRDSGQIEETADTVLMMYREDYYAAEGSHLKNGVSTTEILIRKFRDDIGNQRIVLPFDTNRQWFGIGGIT